MKKIVGVLLCSLALSVGSANSEPRTLEDVIPEYATSKIYFMSPTEPQVELVRISANGTVTYHPKLSIDEVSRMIYKAIGGLARNDCRSMDTIFQIYGDEPK